MGKVPGLEMTQLLQWEYGWTECVHDNMQISIRYVCIHGNNCNETRWYVACIHGNALPSYYNCNETRWYVICIHGNALLVFTIVMRLDGMWYVSMVTHS